MSYVQSVKKFELFGCFLFWEREKTSLTWDVVNTYMANCTQDDLNLLWPKKKNFKTLVPYSFVIKSVQSCVNIQFYASNSCCRVSFQFSMNVFICNLMFVKRMSWLAYFGKTLRYSHKRNDIHTVARAQVKHQRDSHSCLVCLRVRWLVLLFRYFIISIEMFLFFVVFYERS